MAIIMVTLCVVVWSKDCFAATQTAEISGWGYQYDFTGTSANREGIGYRFMAKKGTVQSTLHYAKNGNVIVGTRKIYICSQLRTTYKDTDWQCANPDYGVTVYGQIQGLDWGSYNQGKLYFEPYGY